MFDLQTEAIEAADQLERRGGASTNDANGSVEFPAGGIFLKGLEDSNPDSGDTASDSNALADHQAKNTFRIDTRTGEDQARAEHGAGIGQAPGVGMEHGSDRQDGVKAAHAKDFAEATRKRVQHQHAVRINDAFGMPGGAGGEAHGGAVVFVDLRIAEIIAGFGKQLFVIQEAFRHGVATVGHDDHALEGNILAKFFVQRQEHIVNQEEAVAGLPDDAGNFMRMKAKIQRMQNAASAWNAEECFQLADVIPHHGGHAIAAPQTEFRQCRGEPARAAMDYTITGANDGLIRSVGCDLDA